MVLAHKHASSPSWNGLGGTRDCEFHDGAFFLGSKNLLFLAIKFAMLFFEHCTVQLHLRL